MMPVCDPDGEEKKRKGINGFALKKDGVVFPMAEALNLVQVFVGEVEASAKSGMAVDHEDFAVIAVVLTNVEERPKMIIRLAFDAGFAEFCGISAWQGAQGSDVVIKKPNVQSFLGFLFENRKNRIPEDAWLHDEEFQENVMFGFLELAEDRLMREVDEREIFDAGPLMGAKAPDQVKIIGCGNGGRKAFAKPGVGLGKGFVFDDWISPFSNLFPFKGGIRLIGEEEIKKRPANGKSEYDEKPCHLVNVGGIAVDDVNPQDRIERVDQDDEKKDVA